jgi:hypothetical protein
MNPTAPRPAAVVDRRAGAQWPIAGLFLDALVHRDFIALASCLHPDVRFRALVPPGPFDTTGAAETVSRFQRWFGGDDEFEVVDASIGQVGARIYLRWLVRMRSARNSDSGRLVEQHAFATAGERIESLDLLCSGFQMESAASHCSVT